MEKRRLGKTGLDVSLLGFGCGAVGGLMVNGTAADQERAVGAGAGARHQLFRHRAQYGNGRKETNLGRVLKSLKPDIYVGTKVRLPPTEPGKIGAASPPRSKRASSGCRWSGRSVPVPQCDRRHDRGRQFRRRAPCSTRSCRRSSGCAQQGKFRFFGITAVGETAALHRVVDARAFATAQVSYNLLNPSPGAAVPAGFPAQDYGNLLGHTKAADMGVINIRVLAGGALSGSEERHALASPPPEPIGSGSSLQHRSRTRPPL